MNCDLVLDLAIIAGKSLLLLVALLVFIAFMLLADRKVGLPVEDHVIRHMPRRRLLVMGGPRPGHPAMQVHCARRRQQAHQFAKTIHIGLRRSSKNLSRF